MDKLKLFEYRHPEKAAQQKFDSLVGIDDHKTDLLFTLQNILDKNGMGKWLKTHHSKGLPYIGQFMGGDSLILMSGDVGCGKTELVHCVATPLSKLMDGETVVLFETPSNIRGGGHVGELSARITDAFAYAKNNLRKGEYGILLIDEADDLATSRDQQQAHHEDRSGVNVLIKEIDKVQREKVDLAVILITNRPNSIDPAVIRRAALHLHFKRPGEKILKTLLQKVFEGVEMKNGTLDEIIMACIAKNTPYSYSDITKRIARQSVISARRQDIPLSKEVILDVIAKTEPSPIITEKQKV
jgi:AAA+ superfamily predicted ATPase